MKKVALFCHAEDDPSKTETKQELHRQYAVLENYSHQNGFSLEYAAFHTGQFYLDPPDKILLSLLQHAQRKMFDLILVESKNRFPLSQPDCLPPISLYFLQEAQSIDVGTSTAPIFQLLQTPSDKTAIYWRHGHAVNFDFSLQ